MIPASLLCPVPGACAALDPSIGKELADGVFDAFSSEVASGAVWLVRQVTTLVAPTTTVRLGSAWFANEEKAMQGVALLVAGPLFALAVLGAIARQDTRRLLRIVGVGVPVGVVAGAAAVVLASEALRVVDALCTLIAPQGSIAPLARQLGRLDTPGVPAFVQLLLAAVVVLGALALWLELVLRATTIYLAVFFFPLGMAAMIWPATAPIAKRFVEVLVALIGSRFVIVGTLTLGTAAVGALPPGVDSTVTGAAVLLLAAFCPFAVLRLLPLAEVAAIAPVEGLARRPARVALAASSRMVTGPVGGLVERLSEGETAGLAPAAVVSAAVPERAGEWTPATGFVDLGSDSPGGSSGAGSPPGAARDGGASEAGVSTGGAGVVAPPDRPGGPPPVSDWSGQTAAASPGQTAATPPGSAGAGPASGHSGWHVLPELFGPDEEGTDG